MVYKCDNSAAVWDSLVLFFTNNTQSFSITGSSDTLLFTDYKIVLYSESSEKNAFKIVLGQIHLTFNFCYIQMQWRCSTNFGRVIVFLEFIYNCFIFGMHVLLISRFFISHKWIGIIA